MSRAPVSFSESFKRDAERRLRSAVHKLGDRAIDAHVEMMGESPRSQEFSALVEEEVALDGHIRALRYAISRVAIRGDLDLGAEAEEALRVAEEPRRRRHACAGGCNGHTPAAKAKASTALAKKTKPAKPTPKCYEVQIPDDPAEPEWQARALAALPAKEKRRPLPGPTEPVMSPRLTLEAFNRGASAITPPDPAFGAPARAAKPPAGLQEPLFGGPLMLPASSRREGDAR